MSGVGNTMTKASTALRTRIYIDGYNLYYGCLKGTKYKWLDVRAVVDQILASVLFEQHGAPAEFALQPLAIKYFTAPILKNFAKTDDSVSSQARYHNALRGHMGDSLQIVEGYYDSKPARAHLYEKGKVALDCEVREIWKLEEKQSDVALALHAYSDALRGEVDHIVVVTNDTDIVPAFEMIRAHTKAVIGLVVPAKEHVRKVNAGLSRLSHWTRAHIVESELAGAQLPAMVKYNNHPVHKPLSWYPRPDLLEPIFIEAKRVKKSQGAALKWLHQPCEHLGGRIPIEMAEAEAGAQELRTYMDKYARDFGV